MLLRKLCSIDNTNHNFIQRRPVLWDLQFKLADGCNNHGLVFNSWCELHVFVLLLCIFHWDNNKLRHCKQLGNSLVLWDRHLSHGHLHNQHNLSVGSHCPVLELPCPSSATNSFSGCKFSNLCLQQLFNHIHSYRTSVFLCCTDALLLQLFVEFEQWTGLSSAAGCFLYPGSRRQHLHSVELRRLWFERHCPILCQNQFLDPVSV